MKHIAVAIDGPSGAGKSTIAQAIARKLGFIHVDTGAIYRAVGLYILRQGIDSADIPAITAQLKDISIEIRHTDGRQHVFLNGENVSEPIRAPRVSKYASDVSAIPQVRAFLLRMQRSMAEKNNVVMDGRDIGTVVLPDADVKIFLSASAEERARRRHEEMTAKGQTACFEQVLKEMQQRDYNDANRQTAPLKQANDAIPVDTTGNTLEQSIALMVCLVEGKIKNGL